MVCIYEYQQKVFVSEVSETGMRFDTILTHMVWRQIHYKHAVSIGPVQARYWQLMACLWGIIQNPRQMLDLEIYDID